MSYIVMHRSTKMPTSVKAPYRKVAVVEISAEMTQEPSMISERARGVKRIVQVWDRLHAKGRNTAFRRALAEAEELARSLDREDRS